MDWVPEIGLVTSSLDATLKVTHLQEGSSKGGLSVGKGQEREACARTCIPPHPNLHPPRPACTRACNLTTTHHHGPYGVGDTCAPHPIPATSTPGLGHHTRAPGAHVHAPHQGRPLVRVVPRVLGFCILRHRAGRADLAGAAEGWGRVGRGGRCRCCSVLASCGIEWDVLIWRRDGEGRAAGADGRRADASRAPLSPTSPCHPPNSRAARAARWASCAATPRASRPSPSTSATGTWCAPWAPALA